MNLKKQATQHTQGSHFFQRKMSCLGWDSNPRHSILQTCVHTQWMHEYTSNIRTTFNFKFRWCHRYICNYQGMYMYHYIDVRLYFRGPIFSRIANRSKFHKYIPHPRACYTDYQIRGKIFSRMLEIWEIRENKYLQNNSVIHIYTVHVCVAYHPDCSSCWRILILILHSLTCRLPLGAPWWMEMRERECVRVCVCVCVCLQAPTSLVNTDAFTL